MKLINSLIVFITINNTAFAAGGSGHGSASDLIWPFINVTVLAGILLYILIPKMKVHFLAKSTDVTSIMERANVKAKEAQMLMDVQNKKLNNLDSEISEINKDGENEISNFKSGYAKEVETRISKLKEDAAKKIETEKQDLANNLNEELLDAVIASAKSKIQPKYTLNLFLNLEKSIISTLLKN
jgi:F0F1-type ATP synthase membrane subunit b/b'